MKTFLGLALTAVVAFSATSCGEDQPDEKASSAEIKAAKLPADLCAAVPDGVVERWALKSVEHTTSNESETHEATCSMSGTYEGAPVTLSIKLEALGGPDRAAVRQAMEDQLTQRCGDLEAASAAGFEDSDSRCTSTSADTPVNQRGHVVEVSRSIPSYGLLRVEMSHSGQGWQIVPAEVVAIGGSIANTETAELG